MMTRRGFLKSLLGLGLSGMALGGYAVAAEPFRLRVQRYRLTPKSWPSNSPLRIAALADLHACEPWMSPARIASIVARTNALAPDLIVLLGDYTTGHRFVRRTLDPDDWAAPLGSLRAPLGVHAVLGNHDWWEDQGAQARGGGPLEARLALERAGIAVYENDAVRIKAPWGGFWLAGLGDQLALVPGRKWGRFVMQGRDDLPGTLAQIRDDAPVILMAHEPDIFAKLPASQVALTLCGHTHGGQVRLFGHAPVVPSAYGNRYAYGHVHERGNDLIVSGGLGCSVLPVRFGMPPEIVQIDITA
ncbi:MAG: metallophosphoesterase [Neomegalonema sp.]|nr:metallophosphoesterase [Neomegalonema sp.]